MANYCKKSSIESVVAEVKTKAGISQSTPMPFSDIGTTIDALVIPTQRGSPTVNLNSSTKTHTIQRGVYTGGTVSVIAQQKTATLKSSDAYLNPDSGKVLSSAIIPASTVYTKTSGYMKPERGATSIAITGLSFKPVGLFLIMLSASGGIGNPYIGGLSYINGTVNGVAASSSATYGVQITGASVSVTNTSITLSNITSSEGNKTFYRANYAYFVWG